MHADGKHSKCRDIAMAEAMLGITTVPLLVAVGINTLASK